MRAIAWMVGACACVVAMTAGAGALEECMIKGDSSAVSKCLLESDREAQDALIKAEGDAGKRARDLDLATGRAGAAAALAKSMRAFADYRKAQCDFVRAMYAGGSGAEQGTMGCRVDLTRRRARDLANQESRP
ncbi:MAG: lysozyme inhibitor LprI family protein [Burkholderiales bacterium]